MTADKTSQETNFTYGWDRAQDFMGDLSQLPGVRAHEVARYAILQAENDAIDMELDREGQRMVGFGADRAAHFAIEGYEQGVKYE